MKTRILTALILIPLLVLVLLSGSNVIAGAFIIVSAVGLYEFYKAVGVKDKKCLCALGYLTSITIPLMRNFANPQYQAPIVYIFILILFVIMLAQHKTVSLKDAAMVVFGIIYIPCFLANIFYIRELEYGRILLWLPFIGAFATDTFAYFVGVTIGRHKLCPEISPKKTIEGSVGGILGCMACCMLYGLLLEKVWAFNVNYISLAVLGFAMSIVSQIGDLSASIIKRKSGIKDFGNIFPGHGGVLDRVDSVIMVAPMAYLYVVNVGIFI